MGIAGIILAIICFIVLWLVSPFAGIPFGLASVILASKEKHRPTVKNWGQILGVIGFGISTIDSIITIIR